MSGHSLFPNIKRNILVTDLKQPHSFFLYFHDLKNLFSLSLSTVLPPLSCHIFSLFLFSVVFFKVQIYKHSILPTAHTYWFVGSVRTLTPLDCSRLCSFFVNHCNCFKTSSRNIYTKQMVFFSSAV